MSTTMYKEIEKEFHDFKLLKLCLELNKDPLIREKILVLVQSCLNRMESNFNLIKPEITFKGE